MMNWVVRLNFLQINIKSKKKSVEGTVVSLEEGRNQRMVYPRRQKLHFRRFMGLQLFARGYSIVLIVGTTKPEPYPVGVLVNNGLVQQLCFQQSNHQLKRRLQRLLARSVTYICRGYKGREYMLACWTDSNAGCRFGSTQRMLICRLANTEDQKES